MPKYDDERLEKSRIKARIKKPKGYDYKENEEEEFSSSSVLNNLSQFIIGIIIIGIIFAIGAYIMGELSTSINQPSINATPQAVETLSNVASFFPTLFVVVIAVIILSLIVSVFVPTVNVKQTDEEIKQNIPPHKQTYLEYVQERLKVEREMR